MKLDAAWTTAKRTGRAPGDEAVALLQVSPEPLLHPSAGFGVLWSAKSGSKALMFWYLSHLGLLEQARHYPVPNRPKPHDFRRFVLFSEYQHWWKSCDPLGLKWLRVIRNPYYRAVSSYRHVLGFDYEDKRIRQKMGISIAETGLSFQEFLSYLSAIDIGNCNKHHARQWHPLEQHVRPLKTINLDKEPLLAALDGFEATAGVTPLAEETRTTMLAEWKRESRRHHRASDTGADADSRRFTRAEAAGPWPGYDAFLNEDTRRSIEGIYEKDFTAYADFL